MEFLKSLVFLPLLVTMAMEDLDLSNLDTGTIIEYNPTKEQQLTASINEVSLNLLKYVPDPETDNVCVATYSVVNMMSLLYFGSGGLTEEELKNALQYTWSSLDKQTLKELFSVNNDLLISTKPMLYMFNTSSNFLINGRVGLYEDFQAEATDSFRIPFTVIDFETEGKDAALAINWWISARTNKKLNGIISEVDPSSDILAVDATYFKGIWKNKFSRTKTVDRKFYNMGSLKNTVTIPMMRMTTRLEYYSDDQIKMIELPFKGDIFSMFILLPRDRQGFESLEEAFDHALDRAVYTTKERRVTVTLPKFKFNYTLNVSQSLCDLEVSTICSPGSFNLTEMVSQEGVVMGDMLHKTFIEISEDGMNLEDNDVEEKPKDVNEQTYWRVEATHPFLFSIIDTRSGMILFLGSVKNFGCEGCDSN